MAGASGDGAVPTLFSQDDQLEQVPKAVLSWGLGISNDGDCTAPPWKRHAWFVSNQRQALVQDAGQCCSLLAKFPEHPH